MAEDPKAPEDPMRLTQEQNRELRKLLDAIDPETDLPRCTAQSRTSGERCKQRPVAGATVCFYHGGNSPQVQRKAKLRLMSLVDPAIATLAREMTQADRSSDRLRAAENVLDRSGFPRATKNVDEGEALQIVLARVQDLREKKRKEEN